MYTLFKIRSLIASCLECYFEIKMNAMLMIKVRGEGLEGQLSEKNVARFFMVFIFLFPAKDRLS